MEQIKKFFNDESGATMVEYAILVALIAVAVIITVTAIGSQLNTTFTMIKDCLITPKGATCP